MTGIFGDPKYFLYLQAFFQEGIHSLHQILESTPQRGLRITDRNIG